MPRTALLLALPLALAAAGCDEGKKASEQSAVDEVTKVAALVKTDVEQVRTGMPAGAKQLQKTLAPDFANDLAGLQRTIIAARSAAKPLDVAKSTFFSIADVNGVVLRSEADPDLLANKNVFQTFPALKKAVDPAAGLVEARGEMQEMRGVRTGADTTWVVAHGVAGEDGKARAVFITGWSFRAFAYHLEESAKRDLVDAAQKTEKKLSPIAYVFVVLGDKAYGAPLTPDVDAQAIEALKVVEKTANGPWRGAVDVTNRGFGVAAVRTPELGPDAAVAVMVSQL